MEPDPDNAGGGKRNDKTSRECSKSKNPFRSNDFRCPEYCAEGRFTTNLAYAARRIYHNRWASSTHLVLTAERRKMGNFRGLRLRARSCFTSWQLHNPPNSRIVRLSIGFFRFRPRWPFQENTHRRTNSRHHIGHPWQICMFLPSGPIVFRSKPLFNRRNSGICSLQRNLPHPRVRHHRDRPICAAWNKTSAYLRVAAHPHFLS